VSTRVSWQMKTAQSTAHITAQRIKAQRSTSAAALVFFLTAASRMTGGAIE
jgi:hypothetical protein